MTSSAIKKFNLICRNLGKVDDAHLRAMRAGIMGDAGALSNSPHAKRALKAVLQEPSLIVVEGLRFVTPNAC